MAHVPKEEDMSSIFSIGQMNQLVDRFEFEIRGVLRGTHRIVIVEVEKLPILARLYPNEKIIVSATDGTETIANSDKIFTGFLDVDFENWGTNKPGGRATEPTPAEVYELRQTTIFREMFDSLGRDIDNLCWEQGQIINFCREHRDKLHSKGWGTFFLGKIEGESDPFVACVDVDSGGLRADVYRFDDGNVWDSVSCYRMVVPQGSARSLAS